MKKKIHPEYFDEAEIKCSCGNIIKTGSTKKKMEIEICNACHPFYTGKKKLIDSAGQVDRFQKRMEKSKQIKKTAKAKKTKKIAGKTKKTKATKKIAEKGKK